MTKKIATIDFDLKLRTATLKESYIDHKPFTLKFSDICKLRSYDETTHYNGNKTERHFLEILINKFSDPLLDFEFESGGMRDHYWAQFYLIINGKV